jgi:hypothetical protein
LKVGTTTVSSGAGRVAAAAGACTSAGEAELIAAVIGEGRAHFNADGLSKACAIDP